MKKTLSEILLLTALCAFSCSKETALEPYSPVSEDGKPQVSNEAAICFVPGEYIVELNDAAIEVIEKLEDPCDFFAPAGATSARRLLNYDEEFEEIHREHGLHKVYEVYYDNPTLTKSSLVTTLSAIPGVVKASPKRRTVMTSVFNDPKLSRQWHYINDGSRSGWSEGCDINVLPVWQKYTAGTSNVIVNVVDGGPQLDHEDLAGVVIPGGSNGSKNFYNNNYKIIPHGHGTHVTGTIAAINNNAIGVCGIAGGYEGKGGVKILSSQVFIPTEEYGGDMYNAMIWGADHGAVISQNSWGDLYDSEAEASHSGVGYMKGAIDYFIRKAGTDGRGNQLADSPMKGGVVIFAAGNDGWKYGWPCGYGGEGDTEGKCIAVGATAADYTRAYYSNYGDWVDIAAPGGDDRKGPQVLSTVPTNSYKEYEGTSMACPHVSGVAALLVSYFGGQGFTNDMLIEKLIGGARKDALASNAKIGPLVDAYGSFLYGNGVAPEPVEDYELTSSGNSIDLKWKVTAAGEGSDETTAFGYMVFVSRNKASLESLQPGRPSSDVTVQTVKVPEGAAAGDDITCFVSGLEFSTKYYVTLVGYDYSREFSTLSQVKEISTKENTAPVVETSYTGDYRIRSNARVPVDYHIFDPDHHDINVTVKTGSKAVSASKKADDIWTLTFVGADDEPGDYTAVFNVTDEYDLKTVYKIQYSILPNHAPSVVKPVENMLMDKIGRTVEIDMEEFIMDEDEEVLRFDVTHTGSGVTYVNPDNNILYLTSLGWGLDEITINAFDVKEASCTLTFKVNVRNPETPFDVYPTQTKDCVYVSGGAQETVHVRIYTSSGSVVYDKYVETDAFNPAKIDVSNLAPGIYKLETVSSKVTTVKTFVKI